MGQPIDALLRRLPAGPQQAIAAGTRKALDTSLEVALKTLDQRQGQQPSNWLHRSIVMASGAVGGLAGLPGLLVELPFSLTVMLAVDRPLRPRPGRGPGAGRGAPRVPHRLRLRLSQRERRRRGLGLLRHPGCAHPGGEPGGGVRGRARHRGGHGEKGAPALVQLLSRIAQRLGVSITDKAVAQLVPLIGAAGGAAINTLFIHHYQETAWAHFSVRRLERAYGPEVVRSAYEALG